METADKNHTSFLLLSLKEVSKLKEQNYRRLNITTRRIERGGRGTRRRAEHGKDKVGYNSEHVLENTKGEDLVKSLIKDKRLGKEIMGQEF